MAKPVFLSLTCQTFVFCSDSARLGEKIPQRSEDDFFSQPVQRTALLDQGQKATFAGKKQKCGTLLDSKVENLCLATCYIPPIKSGKENLFLKDSLVHMSYIEQYKEALEVRIFPKRTLPVIKRLHPVSFQQSKDVLLLI